MLPTMPKSKPTIAFVFEDTRDVKGRPVIRLLAQVDGRLVAMKQMSKQDLLLLARSALNHAMGAGRIG